MADISKININGTSYNVVDSGAIRTHQDISGKANTSGTYSGLSVGTSDKLNSADTRNDVDAPSKFFSKGMGVYSDFKYCSKAGIGSSSMYCNVLTINNWQDPSGGYPAQLCTGTNGNGFYYREGNSKDSWNNWERVITSANISSQSVAQAAKLVTSSGIELY